MVHKSMLLLFALCLALLPAAFGLYNVTHSELAPYGGWELTLQKVAAGPYPSASRDIETLHMSVYYETSYRLRILIRDANNPRWEVPSYLRPSLPQPTSQPASTLYTYNRVLSEDGTFGFIVRRADTNTQLFNTGEFAQQFVYSERYIQLTSALPLGHALYGLGERATSLRLREGTYTMWNADNYTQYSVEGRLNMYGSHPAYWQLERGDGGNAHAVVMYNSNQMDIVVTNSSITYRLTGGIVDLSILLGPTPADVASQYTELVGRPHLPPMWALGWHTCRWGVPSVGYAREMVDGYRAGGFPLDVVWHDIDYMSFYFDFTFDTTRFDAANLTAFNAYLASHNLHHVYIVDPGIPALLTLPNTTTPYLPYQQGATQQLFIRHPANDSFLYACVWPSVPVVFPDFSHPAALEWWSEQISAWSGEVGLPDGLWLDMNELSSFVDGQLASHDACGNHSYRGPDWSNITLTTLATAPSVDPNARGRPSTASPSDIPQLPYMPGGLEPSVKSVNVSAHLYLSQFVNVHNLYGQLEQRTTRMALEQLSTQHNTTLAPLRAFTLSRATFLGSGSQGASWTGDHNGGWLDLQRQVVLIQQMGLHGVTMVGSDLCGLGGLDEVNGDGGAEVCTRWLQAGALFPFARMHYQDFDTSHHREPYAWPEPASSMMRQALLLRYSLLTYLNTLTIDASLTGAPLWRPVWFDFSADEQTWLIEQQAMVGPALMAAPITRPGQQAVHVYLPNTSVWYDYHTHRRIEPLSSSREGDGMAQLNGSYAVNASTPLAIRGGYIITTQPAQLTTADTYVQPLTVVAALDTAGTASGYVYLDDGVSLAGVTSGLYQTLRFTATFNASTGQGLFNVTGYTEIDGSYDVSALYVASIVLIGVTATQHINLTLGGGGLGMYCMTLNDTSLTHTNHSLIVTLPPQLMALTADWTLSFNDGCVVPFHAVSESSLAIPIIVLAFLVLLIVGALVYTHLTRRKQQQLNEQQMRYQTSGNSDDGGDLITAVVEEDAPAAVLSPSVGADSDPQRYAMTAGGKVRRKKKRTKPAGSSSGAGLREDLLNGEDRAVV